MAAYSVLSGGCYKTPPRDTLEENVAEAYIDHVLNVKQQKKTKAKPNYMSFGTPHTYGRKYVRLVHLMIKKDAYSK